MKLIGYNALFIIQIMRAQRIMALCLCSAGHWFKSQMAK